eukprot:7246460-Heterocapsa_arctica.AAC.1
MRLASSPRYLSWSSASPFCLTFTSSAYALSGGGGRGSTSSSLSVYASVRLKQGSLRPAEGA